MLKPENLHHVNEFVELMNALTNSDMFSGLPGLMEKKGEEEIRPIYERLMAEECLKEVL